MNQIEKTLRKLEQEGNLRKIPEDTTGVKVIDLTSNDYLGIASDKEFTHSFFSALKDENFLPTSSASRLLASHQDDYTRLESILSEAYGRSALLFNSGFHANVGIIKALGTKNTLFIADKLVHASIIDGLNLSLTSGATFMRFRHNDFAHLRKIMENHGEKYERVIIVAESIYSMDGDQTDLDALTEVRDMHPNAMLYIDEAHAVGVIGNRGLGLSYSHNKYDKVDLIIGTFGKAFASMGAYAIVKPEMREYLVNTARSLIFSTALPPLTVRWSAASFRYALEAEHARKHLGELGKELGQILGGPVNAHIQALHAGDPHRAIKMSEVLQRHGYRALPIRTPTVPPGTDRLRFSLSAALSLEDISSLRHIIPTLRNT